MVKRSKEEIRQLVLQEDAKKDVSIYLAIPIGIISFISFVAALAAAVMARSLEYFRADVSAYWMSCVPFMFPVVTGIYAAYKKQFGLISVHFSVSLLALLMGGFGFAVSVDPIFINRENCVQHDEELNCVREPLSYLYLISGALAAGLTVISFLFTISACYHARKRMEKREREEEIRHIHEVEEKKREARRQRSRALSLTGSLRMHHKSPAFNGVPRAIQAPTRAPVAPQQQPAQPAPPALTQSTAASPATPDNPAVKIATAVDSNPTPDNADVKTNGTSGPDAPGTTTRL